MAEANAGDPSRVDNHLGHPMPFAYLDPVAAAVVEKELIEQRSPDLVAVRVASVGLPEVPAPRMLPGSPDHGGAPLLEEAGSLNRFAPRRAPRGWEGWPAAGTRRCAGAGKRSRSSRTTRWPWRANMVAAVLPPGPPPMTITRLTRISFGTGCPRATLRAGIAFYASSHGFVPPSSLVTIAAASLSADPYSTTSAGGTSRRTRTARSRSGSSWAL